jgi:hypothetical protein
MKCEPEQAIQLLMFLFRKIYEILFRLIGATVSPLNADSEASGAIAKRRGPNVANRGSNPGRKARCSEDGTMASPCSPWIIMSRQRRTAFSISLEDRESKEFGTKMQWFALTFQMEIAILSLQNDIHNCCL